ncbi:AraC family transcriptional regulator [Nitratireductor soli]|uniref:AraC family transcriptional regulator n=1 Tax=Nitratireductor soli TaxID=1670619 RepID=UPI00065DCD6B|nr:AraC family transcriptional regulator [Nitratireductor soli]
MRTAEPQLRVRADGDAFIATSRQLFGPIRQVFSTALPPARPKLVSIDLSACRLSRIQAAAHSVIGDRAMRRSFDPDSVKILMQLNGHTRFAQDAVTVDLEARSAIVYDPVYTYSLQNFSNVDQLILQVPRTTCGGNTLARLARPLVLPSEEHSLVRIVYSLMQMAIKEADKLDEAGCRRVGDSLIQLVHGLVHAGEDEAPGRLTPLNALRARIVGYIDVHIGQGDLSLDEIARQMGCSRRYLHRAFENEEVTLERFIWERRLEASRSALLAPENGALSISEVAFACGFNSSAHFSRAFKGRYGIAPRALRERVRAALH